VLRGQINDGCAVQRVRRAEQNWNAFMRRAEIAQAHSP